MSENKLTFVNVNQKDRRIFIDPSYPVFNLDGLFNLADPVLNRDNQLLSFYRLRQKLLSHNGSVHTADYLLNKMPSEDASECEYYSLGIIRNYEKVASGKLANLAAFIYMEPPIVAPELYKELPKLTATFDQVYIPNVHGDGYSLEGVDVTKLRKMYWPIPYNEVLEPFWSCNDRVKRIVVINGNHKPVSRFHEQYSTRIDAMIELSNFGVVDLFGRGWDRWWSRSALWLPYWRNRSKLMSIYKGVCVSKFEVLQRYEFCLCFENMAMDGYITEKIFDCFYAGVIPLYLGAPDISEYIPTTAYINCRKFSSWAAMWEEISTMTNQEIELMREAGRLFLGSEEALPFFNSTENIVGDGK
ncbi:MAG: glycosyltransferase family 10 [Methylophilaceae bacterium]